MYKVELIDKSIEYPYCVISDIHCHNWSAFSKLNAEGVNNRLQSILDAIREATDRLISQGGTHLVITGDLFHTRGTVKPSVLNPVHDLFAEISAKGIKVHAIPGNHDLEGKESDVLGNAIHTLGSLHGFSVYSKPTLLKSNHLFIPWIEDSQEVLKLASERSYLNPNLTLFMHVGLNGVIPGHISNTLNPEDFLEKDFKYVFSGHFHNHVNFNSRVYSVGALTHQTWNDIDSRAGYLIVYEDKVEQFETKAPKFIHDLDPRNSVRGNYIRMREEMTEEAACATKKMFMEAGALAVLDQTTRPSIVVKSHEKSVKVDGTIESALESYCKHSFGARWEEVLKECLSLTN